MLKPLDLVRLAPLLTGALCALLQACSGSDSSPQGPVDSPETGVPDASTPDAEDVSSPNPDATPEAEVDAQPDTSAEGAIDAPEEPEVHPPYPHCSLPGELPSWVELSPTHYHLAARLSQVTLYLAALEDGVLRLQYAPGVQSPSERSYAVETRPGLDPQALVQGIANGVELCTPTLAVQITGPEGRIRVLDASGKELVSDGTAGGFRQGSQVVDGTSVVTNIVERDSPAQEYYYGFGEKTGPFQKRGQHFVFWNTDAYDSQHGGYAPGADPLYLSIPFFIGLREGSAYGVFTDNTYRVEMDMAKANPQSYRIETFGGTLDQYIVLGPSMAEVVRRYSQLTGRLSLPPRWALGFHQCRWGYSPDTTFESIGQRFRDERIPADTLWLDIQHMDGFRTFTWDPQSFSDPQGMMSRLEAKGFKVTVIADPGIKADSNWDIYQEGLSGNYFLKRADGSVFTGIVWPGASAFPDFTNPAARAWWGGHIGELLALGVRGIWHDVNEPTLFPESGGGSVPNQLAVVGDGQPSTMAEVHNVYALNEAKATVQGMKAQAPGRRPFILTRAGYAGIQRYAAVWTGDSPSTWHNLQETLPMLLSLGLSGVPFVGSDVGGYSGHATPELYARWMALGSISPFFRAHVTSGVNAQEPWEFGTEVRDISRGKIEARYELLPYLYSLFDESSRTGAPILRPMVYEFQEDASVATLSDQAMLGPYLLVAPVTQQAAQSRQVYLPQGRWFEAQSGAIYDGPQTIEVPVTLASLPLFIREGAIVPQGPVMQWTDQQPLSPLTVDLYPAAQTSRFMLYEDAGDGNDTQAQQAYSRIEYSLTRTAQGASLSIGARQGSYRPAARPVIFKVKRVDHAPLGAKLAGVALSQRQSLEELSAQGGWYYDARDLALLVSIPDQDNTTIDFLYDPTIAELAPAVQVELQVTVPQGTPTSSPIHVAVSSSSWNQIPLQWTSTANVAKGYVTVPRGQWFYYKYTRGSWETVEKWPNCEEASNRYGFGAAHPMREDTVYNWRDWCP